MKLHLTRGEGRYQITGTGSGYVSVNGVRYEHSLLVTPDELAPWPVAASGSLRAADMDPLVAQRPEVALIGTGARQHFPPAEVLRPLIDAGIGYEIMDTAAACRTYAILVAEGRRVLAALIVG